MRCIFVGGLAVCLIGALRGSCTRRSSRAPPTSSWPPWPPAVGEAGDAEERFRAGILASFRLIEHRPDVRSLLLGEPGADARVARASAEAQRTARTAMAALYLSEPTFLAGRRNRRAHAEHVAQGAIGTINGLAVLGAEEGLTPERLTALAMDLLWPGIDAMRASRSAG